MFNKILVVYVGNICRLLSGERILQKSYLKNISLQRVLRPKERGLVGKSADAMACEVMGQFGFDLSGHQAQQLTPELCRDYDLILVMEKGHIEAVTNIAPEERGKTMLFGQ